MELDHARAEHVAVVGHVVREQDTEEINVKDKDFYTISVPSNLESNVVHSSCLSQNEME